MPLGLSANSIGLDGRSPVRRRIVGAVLLAVCVIGLCVGGWIGAKSLEPLRPKSIVNGVYEYTFLFYKDAEPVNLVAGQGFKYDDKALLIAKPADEPVITDCNQLNTRKYTWQQAFTAQVLGAERPVCRLGNTVFAVTFFAGQAEHLLEVSYTEPGVVNADEVRAIMESIRVTLQ